MRFIFGTSVTAQQKSIILFANVSAIFKVVATQVDDWHSCKFLFVRGPFAACRW